MAAVLQRFDRVFLVLGARKVRYPFPRRPGHRCEVTSKRTWPTTIASTCPELARLEATSAHLDLAGLPELTLRRCETGRRLPSGGLPFYETEILGQLLLFIGHVAQLDPDLETRERAREVMTDALAARRAILESTGSQDWQPAVARFARKHLGITSADAEWLEAVSTALVGNWIDALEADHGGTLHHLRREARTVHRQLMPLWQRKTGPGRVWMLDYRLPSGQTLHDLLAASYPTEEAALPWEPDRRDIAAVLGRLKEEEQRVARAYALHGGSWAEAAAHAGLPAQAGQRVMRKLRRLGLQFQRQHAAAVPS